MPDIIDTYKTIVSNSEGFYSEKGSKFISLAFPVHTEDEVKENLQAVKKKYYDARHHVYAFVLGDYGDTYRCSDDGEPSNSSGMPVLGQLRSFGLTYTMIVVVRYFGGIKLGVSGLINAYKTAAREALDNATVIEKTVDEVYSLEFPYPLMNDVMRIMKEEGLEQQNPRFEMDCYLEFSTRKNNADQIVAKFKSIFGVTVKYIKTL